MLEDMKEYLVALPAEDRPSEHHDQTRLESFSRSAHVEPQTSGIERVWVLAVEPYRGKK